MGRPVTAARGESDVTACARLARLIWQPGLHMDAGWWTTFEMSGWRAPYLRHAACRPPVDRLLVERRGWPLAGRTNCTLARSEAALVMLHLIPNLRRVALAYGLRVLGCPDYLLLGTFRRALSPWLDAWQCDRLLLTRQEWPSHRAFEADELATAAMATTGEQLDAICTARTSPGTSDTSGVPDDPVATIDDVATVHIAMRILLPPPGLTAAAGGNPVMDDIWPRLAALEKMLCMSSTTH
ncbi:type III secretion system domain-containing protein [Pandoraea sputorum]|uniref:type III secretion system domain-containing protein n=1 Tax=Pandoraea sputorum TaxID=93222 RepID=UPI002AF6A61B|nr:type III secretion system domain-containing protein [Pandoraea sputorum]